jgi:hypothetical protein
MGQARLRLSATAKLLAEFPWCAICGGIKRASTREHMPPKALFDNSHRPDKLVFPACHDCNKGTSTADLVASLISRWGMDSSAQWQSDHSKLATQIKRQAPQVILEWNAINDPFEQQRARRHLERHGVAVPSDASTVSIGPLTIRQLNIFAHKAAVALYFEHFRKPLASNGRVHAIWRTKEDFAFGVPQELINLLPGYATMIQGSWNLSDVFEYKYATNDADGLFGCFVRFRRGLFVLGFAISDEGALQRATRVSGDWIGPGGILDDQLHFERKN